MDLPTRPLGKTGVAVTMFGLGGEGVLRTWGRDAAATALIRHALDQGVTYFDCAKAYAGSEDYHGQVWGADPAARARVFLCSKTPERTRAGAWRDLDSTLRRMQTSYLDLWQFHDLRTADEWVQALGPGGALEAFVDARQRGLVRFLGVTGHHDPALLTRALREFDFDTVLLPVNPAEGNLRGFLDETIPAARLRDMGIIAMKVLGGGQFVRAGLPVGPLLRYAAAQPVSTVIVGCGSPAELDANLRAITQDPAPEEAAELLAALRPRAAQAAYYRGPAPQLA
jgi:aryl-alcohol dehydrogenase-like predicted oxidoreductase